jgi:hypothetical protein
MSNPFKKIGKKIQGFIDDLRGKTAERKANSLIEKEESRQAGVRQEADNYLTGIESDFNNRRRDYLNAVLKANSIGNAYLNNYLANINDLADTNYNQGVTSLQRSIANTENSIRNQMANRGISGAGVDFRNLVNSQGALARGISALQAQRQNDRAKVAAEKYNTGSNVNATNWNRLQSYYNYNPQMDQAQMAKYNLMLGNLQPSMYTQQQIANYQEQANNPIGAKLVSAAVNAAAGNWLGAAGRLFGNKRASSYDTPTYVPQNYDYMQLALSPTSKFDTNWLGSSQTPYYDPYQLELKYV